MLKYPWPVMDFTIFFTVFFKFLFAFLFFSFQIYHSPIHKQAESKSVIISPHILSFHVMIRLTLKHTVSLNASVFHRNIILKCLSLNLVLLFVCLFFSSTVELNEIGFKFVRKCINYIETNGKGSNYRLMPAILSSLS